MMVAAEAAIRAPGSPELAALGLRLVPGQVAPINATPSRFTFPAAIAGPHLEELFDAPALVWTEADVAAAIKQTGDCAAAAKRARNAADTQAPTNLWRSFGMLRATLGGTPI